MLVMVKLQGTENSRAFSVVCNCVLPKGCRWLFKIVLTVGKQTCNG